MGSLLTGGNTENKQKEFARTEKQYVEGELLVKFKEQISEEKALSIISKNGASVIKFIEKIKVYHIKLREGHDVEDAVKELRENAGTQFCPVAVKALISGLRLTTVKK